MSTSSLSSPKGAATLSKRPSVKGKVTSIQSLYPTDRQVKFLHLEAEVETLLIQLQAIQQRRMASKPESTYERN